MWCFTFFFFQAEDGIRDLVRSRGLGDVYKRQIQGIYELSDKIKSLQEERNALTHGKSVKQFSEFLSLIHI